MTDEPIEPIRLHIGNMKRDLGTALKSLYTGPNNTPRKQASVIATYPTIVIVMNKQIVDRNKYLSSNYNL